MSDQVYVYATVAVMAAFFAWQVLSKRFDPFAPVWMFLVGYVQVYVIQAITLREWAIGVRGLDLVTAANFRAFWALVWFLVALFHEPRPADRRLRLPTPPAVWSGSVVTMLAPGLSLFGLCMRVAGDELRERRQRLHARRPRC